MFLDPPLSHLLKYGTLVYPEKNELITNLNSFIESFKKKKKTTSNCGSPEALSNPCKQQ